MDEEQKKYQGNLIISIVALTLAILCVGGLYIRDLLRNEPSEPPGNSRSTISKGVNVSTKGIPSKPAQTKITKKEKVTLKTDSVDHSVAEIRSAELNKKSIISKPALKSNTNVFGKGNGKITLFKSCSDCGDIEVYIDGNFAGKLTASFGSQKLPDCNTAGTLSKVVIAGRHHLSGRDTAGFSWDKMVSVVEGKCLLQAVN